MNTNVELVKTPNRILLNSNVLIILALLSVYLIWGSTYLAIRVAVAEYPPFMTAALRFVFAGGLLMTALRCKGMAWPTPLQWRNCFIVGLLLLGFGNGLVCYAEKTVSSGMAAVAVASMPLFAAIFSGLAGQWPRQLEWIGLAIGFIGVTLLNLGGELRASPMGALALIIAPASWALGSVWSKRQNMPPPAMSTAAQMLCASVVLAMASWGFGESFPTQPSSTATLAIAYLVVAGSIIGFSAYIYLLHNVRPALATSYAYVNPPVAVLFGVILANEKVSGLDIIAMGIILVGVVLITVKRS